MAKTKDDAAITAEKTEEVVVENATAETVEGTEGSVSSDTAEIVTPEEIQNAEVPENAEAITAEEAAGLASQEIERLTTELAAKVAENETISQNFETAKTQIEDLTAKVADLTEKAKAAASGNDNTAFIQFLDDLSAQLENYAGMRKERLRREFVTDLTELIERTRETLN